LSPQRARRVLTPVYVLLGTLHFVRRRDYEAIMPPYIPMHREAVLVSGAAEIAGGLAVQVPGLRRAARWWLTALLVAIFPANLHMALHPDEITGLPKLPRWALWARLPLQVPLIGWAWVATREG
jgi:uncharacterized membrane protein